MPHDHADAQLQSAEAAAESDRRISERAVSTRPIPRRAYRVEDFQPLDVWITDVSCGGLAMFVAEPLADGALLFLELECVPEAEPVKVWAAVVRCRPADGGDWLVGCEFVTRLSERQLDTLLV